MSKPASDSPIDSSIDFETDFEIDFEIDRLAPLRPNFAASIPAHGPQGLRVLAFAHSGKHTVLEISGSKSFANRAVVLAGLSPTPVALKGFLFSDDSYWGLESLARLAFGVDIDFVTRTVQITPPARHQLPSPTAGSPSQVLLHFGMAGTLARFFPAVVLNFATTHGQAFELPSVLATGAKRLCERPLAELVSALNELGAGIAGTGLPLTLQPKSLQGACQISGAKSGQFLSGLLLAAAGARAPIRIERVDNLVQPDYVRMTIGALKAFGAHVTHDNDLTLFDVHCPQGLAADSYTIEADASTACYFISFAVLHNFDLTISNLGSASQQPDIGFVSFLVRMGAHITVTEASISVHKRDTTVLSGGFTADFSAMSDQSLTAGVVALFADAPIEITGVGHIRAHESDRIACLCQNFADLGLAHVEKPDGFVVFPKAPEHQLSGVWNTFHDHRFAMTGFLVASLAPEVAVAEPACVEKTAPDFFNAFAKLGVTFG